MRNMPKCSLNAVVILFLLMAVSAFAQTNSAVSAGQATSNPPNENLQSQTNQNVISEDQIEKARTACIQNRRVICGKIVKVLPDGLVVDSGYTNLMRYPLDRSWLVPGTVTASKDSHFVEANRPDSICAGLVFLSDVPKSRKLKPKLYDYVIISGYPAGQYTYSPLGNIQRTVRRYSAVLSKAVALNLPGEGK